MPDGPPRLVVALGDIPSTGHFTSAAAVRAAVLTTQDESAPGFLRFVERGLGAASEGILVVYPEWQGELARRLLRLARSVLDTDRVAGLGLALPPLSCSLIADVLAYSAQHLPIGVLAGLGDRLQREVLAGARMASVTKLEHVRTRLVDHMASFSPGSGFLVWAAPRPGVVRLSGNDHIPQADFRPPDPLHLLIARQGTDFPQFHEELASILKPHVVKVVNAQPLGEKFWGTRNHVEFVAFSAHPEMLRHLVYSTRYWTCRWCSQPTSLRVCAVCGMTRTGGQEASGPPDAVPPQPPAGPDQRQNGHGPAPGHQTAGANPPQAPTAPATADRRGRERPDKSAGRKQR